MTTFVAHSVVYYSEIDEDLFFEWLRRIRCIERVYGEGRDLYIELKDTDVEDGHVVELIAVFYRYRIDMRQLASLLTNTNAHWFKNEEKFWYELVFGMP